MAFCTRCGTQALENARFCNQCGNSMETNSPSNPAPPIPNAQLPLNTPIQSNIADGRFRLLFRHKAIYFYVIFGALFFFGTREYSLGYRFFMSASASIFFGMLFAIVAPNHATCGMAHSRWKAMGSLFCLFLISSIIAYANQTPQDQAIQAARNQQKIIEEQRKKDADVSKKAAVARQDSAKPLNTSNKEPEKPRNEASINHNGIEYRAYVSSNVIISILSINTTKNISTGFSNTQASGIFKIVKIGAVNNQKDAITLDINSFKLIDNQGREFSVSSEASTAIMMRGDEGFFLKQINPGIGVSGLVAFEVPNDAQIIKMRARGGMTGKPIDIPFRIDKM